jgi:exopolyphosphatase/guanosine-5'-triphosphate,3'-diphosphate pyrophosphatase
MSTIAVVVAVDQSGGVSPAPLASVAASAVASGLGEVVVVVGPAASLRHVPAEATVLVDRADAPSEAAALRAAVDYAQRSGADALVVALGEALVAGRAGADPENWRRMGEAPAGEIVVGTVGGRPAGLVRLAAAVWPLLPLEGRVDRMLSAQTARVTTCPLDVPGSSPSPAEAEERGAADSGPGAGEASAADLAAVTELLGRPPAGGFRVVVRDAAGAPVVIANAPFLDDGTPMPTTYWLVGRADRELVGHLEADGGVRRAERAVDPAVLAAAHARYAAARDTLIPAGHPGPRPTGGVGGTRIGVKCLHAHLAWYLAGGGDPVGRWVVDELDGQLAGAVAAVDCGTNSTRLLVMAADGTTLERRMIVTRLGEGVDRTGELASAGIERTLAALAEYRELIDAHGVVRVRAAATSAARDAGNSAVFFDAATTVLGVRPELIAGEAEGRLSYKGATAELAVADGPFLVVDLGGGSTELVAGSATGDGAPGAVVSLDVGCVRVTERFLASDPPGAAELAAARGFVGGVVDAALIRLPALGVPRRMVGVAGTISTLAALEIGLDHYDSDRVHLVELSRATVEEWLGRLAAESAAQRRSRPAIEPGRADVIVGGLAVLAELMSRLGHESLVHSERDILDGIAAELRGV